VQSLPSLSNSTSDTSQARATSTGVPKYNPQKQSWTAGQDSPLSERSLNDNNIPLSQRNLRHPSKLREVTSGSRGRRLSRTLSASTTQSVQYHTIQHKSASLSPQKGRNETPEWKRRLIHGDVAYGEQRDLFSPAGLENIFRPPPAHSPTKLALAETEEGSVIMPSSPPPYNTGRTNQSGDDRSAKEQADVGAQRSQQPRTMKYKLADEGSSDFSANDLSRSSSFQPAKLKFQNQQRGIARSDNTSDDASSIVRHERCVDEVGRTVSGQSDIRNEKLSPIYVGRNNTVDGKIDYSALDLPPDELQRRLENIREESLAASDQNQDGTDEDLPPDMTVDTDDYAHNGHFINLRRGGHSQEGSFQRRMLSPSSLPAIDESAMLPEESMQASTPKQLPNIKKTRASNEYYQPKSPPRSPQTPSAPHPSPSKLTSKDQKNSSGSPLKLFGTYDTFTNQTLLRRLSQFESNSHDEKDVDGPLSTPHESTRPEMNEAFVAASSPERVSQQNHARRQISKKVNSFGQGELDSFQFSEEMSYDSSRSNGQDDDKENMTLPVLNPDTQTSFRFHLDPSPALDEDVVIEHRATHTNTASTIKHTVSVHKTVRPATGSSEQSSVMPHSQRREDLQTPRKRNGDTAGKRLPKTPLKDPTPKRRRTLHKSEMSYEKEKDVAGDLDSLVESHQQMQSVIGRKRKDARHDNDQQAANPTVLAMRQILRPRTPTPSQRSSQQHGRTPLHEIDPTSLERVRLLQEKKIAKIQAELDSTNPLKVSTALGVSQQMQGDSRKGSVTTQDFLDEAKKIMAGIRGKARPHSGLTSLEESESENDRNQSAEVGVEEAGGLEDSYQESTKEPFSRPPSREGAPVTRLPKKQEDPALLDHLRKYQEMSDMDEVIAESMKSIAMAREAAGAAKAANRIADETISRKSGRMLNTHDGIESDPPNIRISENPDLQRKRKHSTSSAPVGDEENHQAEFPSHGSNASSGQSTSRSIPTGSSRGSDSRKVIAPHSVSHLIPEQVAGMVFDRERNIWVKRKTVSGEDAGKNFLASDETEDDPFGDIPDLSVDETQELQRIKAVAAKRKEAARVAQEEHDLEDRRKTEEGAPFGEKTRTSNHEPSSSEPSKLTQFTSSGGTLPESNTRATSWGDDQAPMAKVAPHMSQNVRRHKSTRTDILEEVVEEVEREISIHEDRVDSASPPRRNVTISFSSPLASVIHATNYEDESTLDHEADEASPSDNDADDDFGNSSLVITKEGTNKGTGSTKSRSFYRSASRRLSLGGHKFSLRPVSRIDEQDEDSISKENDDRNPRSISVVISTPTSPRREASVVLATPRPTHEVGTLTLTPLSEFTMHHADGSFGLDVSYVAQRQRYVHGSNTHKTLSLSIKELVEKLTEVEPYEPFWEHMKQIDLKKKQLTNLHKLDEFCEQLEELDVSRNRISQLDGVPKTVRHLRISHNCLTDLAAWGHLNNLQYVDVSNNEIESLSAFKYLVHLRGLRADNNQIKSLDGISQLDGLLSLRMRNNLVETLDFSGTKLQRLTDLDLQKNKLGIVQNLKELRSLSILNLEENKLTQFSLSDADMLWSLKYLRLSGNNLESIDVSRYPNLRLLYLDRNRLGVVKGLLKTKHLDSLSLREQQTGARIDMSFLAEAFEVRKLFLSGNLIENFTPGVDFLNLQYLELANCGLQSLTPGLGQMISNTRVLNLNLNAIKDLSPLMGIVRLKKLHLAGNRIIRLRATTYVLAHFPNLTLVDMRGNPLTLGFYPPHIEMRVILGDGAEDGQSDAPDPFTQGSADRAKDQKYAERLDMNTKMLRRIYEILIILGNLRLKTLDGLTVDRSVIQLEDEVWEALLATGVLVRPDSSEHQTVEGFPESGIPDQCTGEQEEVTSELDSEGNPERGDDRQENVLLKSVVLEKLDEEVRWPGEDSFA
jgi:protein NUD1